ncbi:hypothetical protein SAMN05444156_0167 [Verrucomicrobium sp. GAS474]|uniref:hypothetical protein n=1 Tax=Verrucomicrobium sp. GAS474 TaxID=1882831 RepID=UPI00087A2E75|nr:hypothetical protein [Verrucomicrobium sp. GAS474]SDT86294.1 hypothetical protein SAMN05444156_0167 [Verrucomicrobium sp. GAS474]
MRPGLNFSEDLEADEIVLWEGRPAVLAHFASAFFFFLLSFGWAILDFHHGSKLFSLFYARFQGVTWFRPFFTALHLTGPSVVALGVLAHRLRLYSQTGYAVTSRRIFFRKGETWHALWGGEVTALDVVSRSWESMADIGTVRCFDGARERCGQLIAHSLHSIHAPYEVYDRIEGIAPQAKGILGAVGLWKGPEKAKSLR